MGDVWLLFLHGINASDQDHWRAPLADAISRHGQSPFAEDRILAPDYRAVLRGETDGAATSPLTWKAPAKEEFERAITGYLRRRAFLESELRPLAQTAPEWVRPIEVADVPSLTPPVDEAKRYKDFPEARSAVHAIVLESLAALPSGARVVILAHSLGSVIAADLLKRLPPGLTVAGLVTIGSPLGSVTGFRPRELKDFPCDRVASWVNAYDPRDPVTGARGFSEHVPWAIDVPIALENWGVTPLLHRHHAEYYCSHNAVGKAIALAKVGSDLAPIENPEIRVDGLELPLLQSLYLRELAKRLPTNDFDRTEVFRRARELTANNHARAAVLIHASNAATTPLSAAEFLNRPDAHLDGTWDDSEILALAIMLASGSPAAPFSIEERWDADERKQALIATLSLVRRRSPDHTDVDIVEAIFAARPKIMKELGIERSLVPLTLAVVGVLVLAGTGVGLAVAAPAGVAGAALITSTLAAFGPGGMVGGMATLATLASAGSALAAAAAVQATSKERSDDAQLINNALGEALSSSSPEPLRHLLIAILTLVDVQEHLGYSSQRAYFLHACLNAQAQLVERSAQHAEIDPGSAGAKVVKEMLQLIGKACSWLRGETRPDSEQARAWNLLTTSFPQALAGRSEPGLTRKMLSRSPEAPRALEAPGGEADTETE